MARCGTRSSYVAGCPCDLCRQANREYAAQRSALLAQGSLLVAASQRVDAGSARAHLERLRDAGVGTRAVASASGVSRNQLSRIRAGLVPTIQPDTREAILAVEPRHAASGSLVDAAPTWSRIEQLLAAGWTRAAISAEIGQGGRALQLRRDKVTRRTAERVDALFIRALGDPAPARRTSSQGDWFGLFESIAALEGIRAEPWRRHAACAGQPTALWFPPDGAAPHPLVAEVCERCPVRSDCRAARAGATGVWAAELAS